MRRVAARAIVLGRMAAQAAFLGKFIDAFLGGCERAMLVAAVIEFLMDACAGAPRIRVANDYAICHITSSDSGSCPRAGPLRERQWRPSDCDFHGVGSLSATSLRQCT